MKELNINKLSEKELSEALKKKLAAIKSEIKSLEAERQEKKALTVDLVKENTKQEKILEQNKSILAELEAKEGALKELEARAIALDKEVKAKELEVIEFVKKENKVIKGKMTKAENALKKAEKAEKDASLLKAGYEAKLKNMKDFVESL